MSNNTVTFRVAGNDILSFMDQVKRKADTLTNDMITNAKKEADSGREQLKNIEAQLKALERKNRIMADAERQLATQNRDTLKSENQSIYDRTLSRADEDLGNGTITRKRRAQIVTHAQDMLSSRNDDVDKRYKEQLTVLREQERQSVLQTKLIRDNIETVRSTSNQQVTQLRRNNGELIDELDHNAAPTEHLAREIAQERYESEKSKSKKGGQDERGVVGGLLNVDNFLKLLNTAQTFTSTQNGFDLIKPASQGVGQILGALLGGAIGTLVEPGGGTMIGAGIGGSIGSTIGGGVGEFEQRRGMAAQEFLHNKYAYEAMTQQSMPGIPDESKMGVATSEYLATLKQIATSAGSTNRAVENTNDVLEMNKGLGIGEDTMQQFITLFRGTQQDLSNLVGGVMNKGKNSYFAGGDYTFLNEFLGKMAQLQSSMQQNTDKVNTGTTFDILSRFNQLGGAFRTMDPRSLGLISQMQSALVHPTSESSSAFSFLALRKANPNMGIADLIMERERGLASPTYLKSMLQYVDSMGGDSQFKRMNIAGMFGVNQAAAKRIYDHRKALMSGSINQDEINSYLDLPGADANGNYRGAAESKTTPIEKNTADIKNGLLGQWYQTLDAMQDSFKTAMENAFAGATIKMQNGVITFAPNTVKQNTSHSGTSRVGGTAEHAGAGTYKPALGVYNPGGNILPTSF